MSDEIKEILEYYQKDIDKFEHSMKDYNEEQLKTTFEQSYQRYRNHKLLLDYITNLQEEKEKLNNIINELKKYIGAEWYCFDNESVEFEVAKDILDKLQELKGSDKSEK